MYISTKWQPDIIPAVMFCGHGITYPHRASTVALPIDENFETARFHDVKHKALQSKRLSINVRHTRLPFAGFSVCSNAKIMNLSENYKVLTVKIF